MVDYKKSGVMIFATLLILSFFASVALAAEPFNTIRNTINIWSSGGGLGNSVDKLFIGIIIFLLITAVLTAIPTLEKQKGIVMIIGAIIAIIATSRFTTDEVLGIVTSYTALGLAISVLLPFIVMVGLTYNAVRSGDATLSVLSKFAWLLFAIFSGYRFLIFPNGEMGIGFWIIGISSLVGIIMFFGSKQINSMLYKTFYDADIAALKDRVSRAEQMMDQMAKATKH